MAQPDPGWYVDPDDATLNRYWDGQAWTEHRTRAGERPTGATVPPVGPHPTAAPTVPDWPTDGEATPGASRRRGPLIAAGAVLVVLAVVVGAVVWATKDRSGSSDRVATATTTEVTPTAQATGPGTTVGPFLIYAPGVDDSNVLQGWKVRGRNMDIREHTTHLRLRLYDASNAQVLSAACMEWWSPDSGEQVPSGFIDPGQGFEVRCGSNDQISAGLPAYDHMTLEPEDGFPDHQ